MKMKDYGNSYIFAEKSVDDYAIEKAIEKAFEDLNISIKSLSISNGNVNITFEYKTKYEKEIEADFAPQNLFIKSEDITYSNDGVSLKLNDDELQQGYAYVDLRPITISWVEKSVTPGAKIKVREDWNVKKNSNGDVLITGPIESIDNHEIINKDKFVNGVSEYSMGCSVPYPICNLCNKDEKANVTNGVTCKKCNDFNEYCDTPSEPDGSHICYKCRKGY